MRIRPTNTHAARQSQAPGIPAGLPAGRLVGAEMYQAELVSRAKA